MCVPNITTTTSYNHIYVLNFNYLTLCFHDLYYYINLTDQRNLHAMSLSKFFLFVDLFDVYSKLVSLYQPGHAPTFLPLHRDVFGWGYRRCGSDSGSGDDRGRFTNATARKRALRLASFTAVDARADCCTQDRSGSEGDLHACNYYQIASRWFCVFFYVHVTRKTHSIIIFLLFQRSYIY